MPQVWQQHQYAEFVLKDVEGALSTVVEEPYVLVPSSLGGFGREGVRDFYANFRAEDNLNYKTCALGAKAPTPITCAPTTAFLSLPREPLHNQTQACFGTDGRTTLS